MHFEIFFAYLLSIFISPNTILKLSICLVVLWLIVLKRSIGRKNLFHKVWEWRIYFVGIEPSRRWKEHSTWRLQRRKSPRSSWSSFRPRMCTFPQLPWYYFSPSEQRDFQFTCRQVRSRSQRVFLQRWGHQGLPAQNMKYRHLTKKKIDAQQQIWPESQMLQGRLEARRSHIGHKLPVLLGKSPSRSANVFWWSVTFWGGLSEPGWVCNIECLARSSRRHRFLKTRN